MFVQRSWTTYFHFLFAITLALGCSKKDDGEKLNYYPGMTPGTYEPPRTSSADLEDDDAEKRFSKEDIRRMLVEIIYGNGGDDFGSGGRRNRYRVQNRRHPHRFPEPVFFPPGWDWSQRLPLNNATATNTTTVNNYTTDPTKPSGSGNTGSSSLPPLTCRVQMNKINFKSGNTLPDDLNRSSIDIIDITQEQAFFSVGTAEKEIYGKGAIYTYSIDLPIVRDLKADGTPKVETLHGENLPENTVVRQFIPVNSAVQPTSSFVWATIDLPGSGRAQGKCQGAVNVR